MRVRLSSYVRKFDFLKWPASKQQESARTNKVHRKWLDEKTVKDAQGSFDFDQKDVRPIEQSLGFSTPIKKPSEPKADEPKMTRAQRAKITKARHIAWLNQQISKAHNEGDFEAEQDWKERLRRYLRASRGY